VVADDTAKESRFTGKINWVQLTSVLTTMTTSSTPRNGCMSPRPGSSQHGLAAAPWLPGLPVVFSPALEPLIVAGTNISVAVGLSYNRPRDHFPLVRPGMNVIVNDSTKWVPLIILLPIKLAISLTRCVGPANRTGGDQPTSGGVRKDNRSGDGELRP
jgi:hypothetical protein